MLTPSFTPFPTFETPRLRLRRPVAADAEALFLMRSDPEVMRYIPRPLAQTVADVHELLKMLDDFAEKGERINWAIEWRDTGDIVGLIGFVNLKPEHRRGEVGYSLNRAWHRRGIMLEALEGVLDWGFNSLGLHSIEAIVDADNRPSAALLEKAGFQCEARFREDFFYNGMFRDSLHYGMLQWEFLGSRNASGATSQAAN